MPRLGGLSAITLENSGNMKPDLLFDLFPERLLRALYIRESITEKLNEQQPGYMAEHFPDNGTLPIILYNPNGKQTGFTEIHLTPERIKEALDVFQENGTPTYPEEIPMYEWALHQMEARERARAVDLPAH